MEEQDPTEVTYYLEDSPEARKKTKKVLDENYDILGYPKEKRIYQIEKQEDLVPLYEDIDMYVYEARRKDTSNEKVIGYGGADDWWKKFAPKDFQGDELDFQKEYVIVPKGEGDTRVLALGRITLGIKILSELILDGFCNLDAEL